jgi:hypothetical protein
MYNNHQRFLVPNRPELVPFHNLNLNQMAQAQNQPLGRIVPHPSIQVANNTSHQIPHVINNQIPN